MNSTRIKGYFRVTEYFELERTFRAIKPYPSVLTRLFKAPSNLTLKVSRDVAFTASSGKPHCKEFLSYIQSKAILFQFKTVVPSPVTRGLIESLSSSYKASLIHGKATKRSSWSLFFFILNTPNSPKSFFIGEMF